MAGIEKICEFSGEYPDNSNMYAHKRNSIQVLPKYRKLFRGAEHTLKVYMPARLCWMYNSGGYTAYCPDPDWDWLYHHGRVVKEHSYELIVTDPALQGRVEGVYLNHTLHLPTVRRKLKRLLRCKKLNIVFAEGNPYE